MVTSCIPPLPVVIVASLGACLCWAPPASTRPIARTSPSNGPSFRSPAIDPRMDFTGLEDGAAFSAQGDKVGSVLDQVHDPNEKKALRVLLKNGAPGEKRRRAETFLKRYPNSALLATVVEIAAKACIDLGDFSAALQYGRESLSLLSSPSRAAC